MASSGRHQRRQGEAPPRTLAQAPDCGLDHLGCRRSGSGLAPIATAGFLLPTKSLPFQRKNSVACALACSSPVWRTVAQRSIVRPKHEHPYGRTTCKPSAIASPLHWRRGVGSTCRLRSKSVKRGIPPLATGQDQGRRARHEMARPYSKGSGPRPVGAMGNRRPFGDCAAPRPMTS